MICIFEFGVWLMSLISSIIHSILFKKNLNKDIIIVSTHIPRSGYVLEASCVLAGEFVRALANARMKTYVSVKQIIAAGMMENR